MSCTEEEPELCEEQLLLCDAETNACMPCVEHAECASGACNLVEGTCFPNDASVSHVDGDGGQTFTSIDVAITNVADGDYGIIIVHELDGGPPYTSGLTADGGKTLALFAAPGEDPLVQGAGGDSGLVVTGAETTVYIEEVDFTLSSGRGLVVNAGTAWVDRSRIVQNSGGGVLAENGANLTLRNCFVGQGSSSTDSITVTDSTATILYTTVVAGGGLANPRALVCTSSVTSVRNSLILSEDEVDEIACNSLTMTFSASENSQPGEGNEALSDVQLGWVVNLSGDFHLDTPPAAVLTTAQWSDGDPLFDIDGDPRPGTDGSSDVAGADVP